MSNPEVDAAVIGAPAAQHYDLAREYYVNELYPKKVRLDLEYAKAVSFAGDVRILAQTMAAIFS